MLVDIEGLQREVGPRRAGVERVGLVGPNGLDRVVRGPGPTHHESRLPGAQAIVIHTAGRPDPVVLQQAAREVTAVDRGGLRLHRGAVLDAARE